MKKAILSLAMVGVMFVMTGCMAIVGSANGAPTTIIGGLYSEVSGNTLIQQPTTDDFTVVKHNVVGTAKLTCIFGIVTIGDTSYETLKASALKNAPGADDIIDIKYDYSAKNILGLNDITVKMIGTAIKYK